MAKRKQPSKSAQLSGIGKLLKRAQDHIGNEERDAAVHKAISEELDKRSAYQTIVESQPKQVFQSGDDLRLVRPPKITYVKMRSGCTNWPNPQRHTKLIIDTEDYADEFTSGLTVIVMDRQSHRLNPRFLRLSPATGRLAGKSYNTNIQSDFYQFINDIFTLSTESIVFIVSEDNWHQSFVGNSQMAIDGRATLAFLGASTNLLNRLANPQRGDSGRYSALALVGIPNLRMAWIDAGNGAGYMPMKPNTAIEAFRMTTSFRAMAQSYQLGPEIPDDPSKYYGALVDIGGMVLNGDPIISQAILERNDLQPHTF